MSDTHPEDDDMIEAHFAAARAREPEPSQDLISRVLADAATLMPAAVPPKRSSSRLNLWSLLAPLGGLGGVAALTASAVVGIGIGYGTPDSAGVWSIIELGQTQSDALDFFGTDTFEMSDLEG